jgi:hypothetical protein
MPRAPGHIDHHPPLDPYLVFAFASIYATARELREGRHDLNLQRLADNEVPWAQVVPREPLALFESDSGAADVEQDIVDIFRFGDELHTVSEDARAADGQHRKPVPVQRMPADDAVQEPLRASREFEDAYAGHG